MSLQKEVTRQLMKGTNSGTMIAELIDALAVLIGMTSVVLIDEEGDGGCTGLFIGNAFVAENLIETLENEVQYEYFNKGVKKDLQ